MNDNPKITVESIRRVSEQLLKGGAVDLAEIREMLPAWLEGPWDNSWCEAMLDLSSAMWRSGEAAMASDIYDKCLETEQEPINRFRALLGKGIVASKQSAFKEASDWMEAAAQLAGEQLDYEHLQLVRRNQLILLQNEQKWDELAQKARVWVKANDVLLIGLLFDAASIMYDLERYEDAITVLEPGAALFNHDMPMQIKVKWLEALIRNLRAAGDDYLAQVYCQEAIQLDRLRLKSEVMDKPETRQELARVYDLLTGIYTELEENNSALQSTTLFLAEALKEMKFSAPLPRGALTADLKPKEDEIILKLVAMESQSEHSYRREMGAEHGGRTAWEDNGSSVLTTGGAAHQQDELIRQLEALRTHDPYSLTQFDTQIDYSILGALAVCWPAGCAGLAYRLDLEELTLHTYFIQPDGNLLKFLFDINYAAVRALLNICKQGIARELEFLADRLTEVLLPKPLQRVLWAAKGQTLLLSADPRLEDVPWEAIGIDGDYLGTSFDLVLTPSLLRSMMQLRARQHLFLRPSQFTIVANPTQDLPFSLEEAKMIKQLLSTHGFEARLIPTCKHNEFLSLIPDATWLHYAGHANYLHADPGSSYLHLHDHLLTVREIAEADIAKDTVWILNACEAGRTGGGEGVGYSMGLSRILLLKGACAALAANWPTDDEASAHTLSKFYRQFVKGNTSLAGTMRNVRQLLLKDGYSMYEWAQYSVFGHPFVMLEGDGKISN